MGFPNTSAGVYDQERDLSQRGGQVISSIAAIVIESGKGDTKEWVEVFDKQDLLEKFGVKDFQSYGFGMHCAEQYLTQSRIFIKRAINKATARTAGAYLSVDDVAAARPVVKLVCFDDGTSNQPKGIIGDPAEQIGFQAGTAGVGNAMLALWATSAGKWANSLAVRIRPSAPLGTDPGQHSDSKHFYIEVFVNFKGEASVPVESFLVSRSVELDGEGQQMFVEDRVNALSKYIRVKNNDQCPAIDIYSTVFEYLDGGDDGQRASQQEIIDAWDGMEDTDAFPCQILVNGGYTNQYVQQKMNAVAVARGDAIAILDIPFDRQEVARAVDYRRNVLNLSSSFSAIYGPWAEITDDVSGRRFWCPISGLVAAQFAYTDRVRAYYWAPAGIQRGQVRVNDIYKKYSLQERNALDQAQINVVRKIPKRGFVIFDQQTLQSFASGFQNVNVRRLVNGLKSMLRKAFLPAVFNPNDEFERLRLKNMVDTEMQSVKNGRGVYAWETVCDSRNNNTDTIAAGDLVLDLILDPEIPAKRAHLGADIRNYGSSVGFSED